jgi:ABC-type transporter Mla MlaB component
MKYDRSNGKDGSGRAKRTQIAKPKKGMDSVRLSIRVERSGDWMPAEELWNTAQEAVCQSQDVSINLDKIDHLDASALQILLALDAEQMKRGCHLQLENASASLRHWFEYSGATGHFSLSEQKADE